MRSGRTYKFRVRGAGGDEAIEDTSLILVRIADGSIVIRDTATDGEIATFDYTPTTVGTYAIFVKSEVPDPPSVKKYKLTVKDITQ